MDNKDQRFIEDTFPIREVSEEGAKEKNIRHGHISTMHIWWARRPLSTSRATNFAALISTPEGEEEKQKMRNFISELSKWENTDNEVLINKAQKMILERNNGVPPKVIDPFGGGGSIPMEALRLGCETFSNDYNPVAVLIQKCTFEFPQKFGKPITYNHYAQERPWIFSNNKNSQKINTDNKSKLFINEAQSEYQKNEMINPLLEDVKYWGNILFNNVQKELIKFYPSDPDRATTVGYIWARTIPCQNPTCGVEIPLMRQYYLSKKAIRKVALMPVINGKRMEYRIISGEDSLKENHFNPENGTISRAVVNCPVCGSVIDSDIIPELFRRGKSSQRMIVVVTFNDRKVEIKRDINDLVIKLRNKEIPNTLVEALKEEMFNVEPKYFQVSNKTSNSFLVIYNSPTQYIEFKVTQRSGMVTIEPQGKNYRIATSQDQKSFLEAEKELTKRREELITKWGMDPKPDEDLPPVGTLGFRIQRYGLLTWGDLFNNRELLALILFCEGLHNLFKGVNEDNEYYKAVACYLALGIDRLANRCSTQNVWNISAEKAEQVFLRQTMQMLWDYCEVNAIGNQGWGNQFYYIEEALKKILKHPFYLNRIPVIISNSTATKLNYPNDFFDAVFTDPPYYDNVPYSHLSDFFFIWLKRSIGTIFPEYFSTPLTPKKSEIVAYSHNDGGAQAGKVFFEDHLRLAFREINRILKPNGIAIIVYAHKSTSGWETVINALLDSSLIITGSYPLNTEMEGRMRATDSASLSSSIYIVARKREKTGTGFYNEVKEELKKYLNKKLSQLWGEGIIGADFFIAAIGSAIEVFGKYERVIDYEGNIKRADTLLDDVREIVMNYTVTHILHNGFSGEVSELTKFYVIYRFSYGEAKLEFDEANKLARSVGIDLSMEFNKNGFIKKETEYVRVLSAINREEDDLRDKNELIDVLHYSILLWEAGRKEKMMELLAETGFGKSEAFFRVAQAISESLAKTTPESKEKKLLDGFLGGKERIKSDVTTTKISKKNIQGKLEF
jgi:putative DNA methylase